MLLSDSVYIVCTWSLLVFDYKVHGYMHSQLEYIHKFTINNIITDRNPLVYTREQLQN